MDHDEDLRRTPAAAGVDDRAAGEPGPAAAVPVSRGRPTEGLRLGRVVLAVAAAILLLGVVSWLRAPSDHALVSPGPMTDLRAAVTVSGPIGGLDDDFAAGPPIWLTTIDAAPLTNFGRLAALLPWSTVHTAPLRGDVPLDQRPASAHIRMGQSRRTSVAVAATLADRPTVASTGVQISAVLPDTPAAEAGLRIGETVVAVDGVPAATTTELLLALSTAAGEGRTAVLTLGIGDESRDVEVSLPPEVPTLAGLGILAEDRFLDVGIDFDIPAVSGGSGGLMMTLAVAELLTDGSLLPFEAAGTGTVAPDGTVGYVAGSAAKAEAAAAEGAAVFFAPPGTEAPADVDGMPVVVVDTVADAVAWLCGAGADPERLCP